MSKNIFSILFFFLLAFATISTSGQNARIQMENGLKKYHAKDYQGALESFKKVARINSDYPEVYEYAGNAFFILKDYVNADKAYTIALEKKYQNNLRSGNSGTYRQGNIAIIAPDPSGPSSSDYAMIYNNRGAARLFRGDKQGAQRDFKEALKLDSDLTTAKENLKKLNQGNYQSNPNSGDGGFFGGQGSGSNPNQRGKNQNAWEDQEPNYLGARPVNDPNKPVNIRQMKEETINLRENRSRSQSDNSNFFTDIFKSKPFETRRVPRKGKLYKAPPVGASSRNYITIESIRITQNSTYVNFKVVNRKRKTFYLSLAPKDIEESAFMITDRQGSKKNTYKMVDVSGIKVYPQSSPLDPQAAILFTVEFPKISDTMGYINIIEGNKQTGSEWNFYNVDLTQ